MTFFLTNINININININNNNNIDINNNASSFSLDPMTSTSTFDLDLDLDLDFDLDSRLDLDSRFRLKCKSLAFRPRSFAFDRHTSKIPCIRLATAGLAHAPTPHSSSGLRPSYSPSSGLCSLPFVDADADVIPLGNSWRRTRRTGHLSQTSQAPGLDP